MDQGKHLSASGRSELFDFGLLAALVRSEHVRRVAVEIVTAVVIAPSRSRISVARLRLLQPAHRPLTEDHGAAAHLPCDRLVWRSQDPLQLVSMLLVRLAIALAR